MDYLQEAQEAQVASGTKNYKIFWFIFFGIIFIVIFLIIYLAFIATHKNISDNKMMEGVAFEVGENDAVRFNLNEEEHGMKINFVGYDSVDVTISSEPINLSLKLNEVEELDLDKDGVNDIRIKLISIVNGKATIAIQKIVEEACKEDWECSEWSDCSKGIQKRDCDDLNSCGTTFYKPSEKKDCLEIDFVESNSAFDNLTNKSLTANFTNNTNLTIYNQTNYTNTNNTNTSFSNPVNQTRLINCNSSLYPYSCLADAAETCNPAFWNYTEKSDYFGIVESYFFQNEIKGYSSDGRCIYYEKTIYYPITYSEQHIHELLQQGYTSQQINQLLYYETGTHVLSIEENICNLSKESLSSILTLRSTGAYSTDDFANADCSPHKNFECKLEFGGLQTTDLYLPPTSSNYVPSNVTLYVYGFSNASKVVWSVENSSVIRLSSLVGVYSKVYPLKIGRTVITVKDTSLDSCELRLPFEVYGDTNGAISDIPTP